MEDLLQKPDRKPDHELDRDPDRKPKAFRWTWQLASATPERILFVLPLKRLFVVALVALLLGLTILQSPEWSSDQPRMLVLAAGWSGVLIFLGLAVVVTTHRGRLTIDAATRSVHLELHTPFDHTDWQRSFDAFEKVRTKQVKDQHGLHNHWQIQLVANDGTSLLVGHGLNGSIKKRSRDEICRLVADMLGIPIEHATNR